MMNLRKGDKTDAEALAALILSSAPVLLPYLFMGREKALRYILQAAQEPDGQYSAVRHQIATEGTTVIGCITLWDSNLPTSFHSLTIQSLTKFLSSDQIAHLITANSQISQVFAGPLPHQFCVGHLAVLDKYKGIGIGRKLVAYAISQAKHFNKKQLVLDVDSSSDEAIGFYRALNFKLMKSARLTTTNQLFHRMQYTL